MDGVSEVEILRLVAERESARQARRFAESDGIREQLRSMGVELYDKEREWRANDGRRGVLFTAGAVQCSLSDYEITALVASREDARTTKDFSRADNVRDDLRRSGVELDDKTRTWRTGNGRSGSYNGQTTTMLTESEIRSLVADRERARANQDFSSADDIRSRLSSLGVELFDNQRIWRSNDGRQGVIVTGGVEVSRCSLKDSDICARVQAREDARHQKDFSRADTLRDELRRMGVELIDADHRWQTMDGRSGQYGSESRTSKHSSSGSGSSSADVALSVAKVLQSVVSGSHGGDASAAVAAALASVVNGSSGGSGGGGSLSQASIEALVYGREVERDRRDFAAADMIRQDLRNNGVEVWDKQRTWNCSDGRSGPYTGPNAGSQGTGTSHHSFGGGSNRSGNQGMLGNSMGMHPDLAAVMALAGRIS